MMLVGTVGYVCGCGQPAANPDQSNGQQRPGSHEKRAVVDTQPDTSRPKPPDGLLPAFTDVAQAVGVRFRRYDDIRGLHRILESLGGGVGLFDYDGDGRLDVFYTDGCRLPLAERGENHPNRLFRNTDRRRLAAVTRQAGLLQYGYSHGCAVADYNNDGFPDLYVTAYGPNSLWRNNGDGTFTDVTGAAGVGTERWSSSAAFADLNRDGCLDLYVANYLQADDDPPRLCPSRRSPDGYVQCPPEMFAASEDVLFLADGRGSFFDVTAEAGTTAPDGKGLGVVIFDPDRNGWPDIYVANDGTPNFLYWNQGTAEPAEQRAEAASGRRVPRFREQATLRGASLNRRGFPEAGMGIACGDYDADGFNDLFVTHFTEETNTLYRNLAGEGFADVTYRTGLAVPSRSLLGFGTEFLDYDNDGWLDLFAANGHVDDKRFLPHVDRYRMPPLMFRNEGDGTFVDVSIWSGRYFRENWLGRGAAVGDLNADGKLDLVVSHQLDPSVILQNDTRTLHRSVLLRLIGRGRSNRSAVGAVVRTHGTNPDLVREVIGGGSFLSASDRRVHIGLQQRDRIPRLRIEWPSGDVEEYRSVEAGMYAVIEGRGVTQLPSP